MRKRPRHRKNTTEEGTDVNVKDNDGDTALMLACYYKHTEIVRILLDNGADVNAKDYDGDTALRKSIRNVDNWSDYNSRGIIESMLLERGADVNAKTNDGYTALTYMLFWKDTCRGNIIGEWG